MVDSDRTETAQFQRDFDFDFDFASRLVARPSFLINVLMANDFDLARSTIDEIALINGLPG